jgi:hypothetical protein
MTKDKVRLAAEEARRFLDRVDAAIVNIEERDAQGVGIFS